MALTLTLLLALLPVPLSIYRVQHGAVPQFTHPPKLHIQISGHPGPLELGRDLLLIELDTESLGTAPCARVMPRPQRLACLRFYCPAPSWLFQPCLCCLAVPFALGLPAGACVCFA